LDWPQTAILQISASQQARITGMSHWGLDGVQTLKNIKIQNVLTYFQAFWIHFCIFWLWVLSIILIHLNTSKFEY
jgi:hypothetical protein